MFEKMSEAKESRLVPEELAIAGLTREYVGILDRIDEIESELGQKRFEYNDEIAAVMHLISIPNRIYRHYAKASVTQKAYVRFGEDRMDHVWSHSQMIKNHGEEMLRIAGEIVDLSYELKEERRKLGELRERAIEYAKANEA
jgi:hypothetical protein